VVKILIEHGADVNKEDIHGQTPSFFAYMNGYLDIVEFLIKHGAYVNYDDFDEQIYC